MAEAKTQPTQAAVAQVIAAITDAGRRAEADVLLGLMRRATQQAPVMWGPSIVGFGQYRYALAGGRWGQSCATGFAMRKADISVYLVASAPQQEALLARLGPHRMGKACLSIKRLADVDLAVLEQLVAGSYAEVLRLHGPAPSPD